MFKVPHPQIVDNGGCVRSCSGRACSGGKINKNKIIALSNSDNTPDEVLSIYKKHKVTETTKMSSSLKFCILAAGEADIYAAKARACEWDIAAGHAILIHAGGLVTDHNNEEFLYGKKDYKNTPIIAKRSSNLEA